MASPFKVSGMFSELIANQASAPEDAPDWLTGSEQSDEERPGRSSSSDDLFAATPSSAAARQGAEGAAAQRYAPAPPSLPPAAPVPAAADPVEASRKPLVQGGKVGFNKVLVEIPAGPEAVVDLSGDAGAIGRFTVVHSCEKGTSMLLDLKGVVYETALLPLAGTACIVAMGGKEAKVEACFNDFLQLEKSARFADDEDASLNALSDWDADEPLNAASGFGTSEGKVKKPKGKGASASIGVASGKVVKATPKAKKSKGSTPKRKKPA